MSTEVAEILPVRRKKDPNRSNLDTDAKLIAMRMQGVKPAEIAKNLGVTPGNVYRKLQKFAPVFKELKSVGEYRVGRGDLLDAAELAALKNVVSKMDKGSLRECVYAFDKVFTAGRLTRGESTANHSHRHSFTSPQLKEIANETE